MGLGPTIPMLRGLHLFRDAVRGATSTVARTIGRRPLTQPSAAELQTWEPAGHPGGQHFPLRPVAAAPPVERPFAVRVLAPPKWSPSRAASHLRQLFQHADLLAALSRHRINVRYKQSILGGLWAMFQPLAMMVVYTAVFSRLVKVPTEGVPYAVFAYSGLLPWTFFSTAVSNGTSSLVSHASLVTKVYFPREMLPISYVIAAAVDVVIGAAALVALIWWFDVPIGWSALAIAPIMLTLSAFALACALVLSAIQVRFRDIGLALPVLLQLWMFASPVLYPLRLVPDTWREGYLLNPIAGLVENFRRAAIGMPLDAESMLTAAVVSGIALPAAYLVFKHVEATVADVI
jgi:lipopolysaccharide transport system permease protein